MRTHRLGNLEEIAYHEAAHAVVGWILGWPIISITIDGVGPVRGWTSFMEPRPKPSEQMIPGILQPITPVSARDLPDMLTRLHAGVVGQRIIRERRGLSVRGVRLGGDIRQAREMVRSLDIKVQRRMLAEAQERAQAILSRADSWNAVAVLVQCLLEFPTLGFVIPLPPALTNLPLGSERRT